MAANTSGRASTSTTSQLNVSTMHALWEILGGFTDEKGSG